MSEKDMEFTDFLNDCSPEHTDVVTGIHDALIQGGCVVRMKLAKSGHVVSFVEPKTKKVVANFVSRKKGPVIRIYGDHAGSYLDDLAALPETMIKTIDKSSDCKRLLDPTKCSSRCPMGFDVTIGGARYQKCRYSGFMFEMNAANMPFILTLVGAEIRERAL